MVDDQELERLRMKKANPGLIGRAKQKLQRFREKQVEFGSQARERAITREAQKVELAKLKTERKQIESQGRQAVTRARLGELKVSRQGGSLFGSVSSPPRKRKIRIRAKPARTSLRGGRKVRVRKRIASRAENGSDPFGMTGSSRI